MFCGATNMKQNPTANARLYTYNRGILPVFSQSYYCKRQYQLLLVSGSTLTVRMAACHASHHPGYYVQNPSDTNSVRRYYAGIPKYLQIEDSVYIEREAAESFRWQFNIQQCVVSLVVLHCL